MISMAHKDQHAQGMEELLQRAREEESAQVSNEPRRSFQATKVAGLEAPVLRTNRRAIRRSVSTFNIIALIFCLGIAIVLYISNIIAVKHLAAEIRLLQEQYDETMNAQAILLAEIDRKSSWERIGRIATGQLLLHFPQGQVHWITPDEELLRRLVDQQQP